LSWCDKLAATPTVGIKVDFHFDSIDAILHALSPVLNRMVDGDRATFTVERREPFVVNVIANDGFTYSIEPTRISILFQHIMKMKMVSGGPPVAELLSHPLPYTQLLSQAGDRLTETATLLCGGTPRKVTRVGIVTTTAISAEDMPPGITRFLIYMSRPWKGAVPYYSWQITAHLVDSPQWSDRCIHTLARAEDDPEQLVRLSFDWQRYLNPGRAITTESTKELIKQASDTALRYFEEVAEGNQFDEELIRSST
jgi:hypothetical protein